MIKRYDVFSSILPPQPRIAAIVSCQENLMSLSWHMPISRDPFRYAIAVREENFTHSLLVQHGHFALNFLPFAYYNQIDQCGRVHGNEIDKSAYSGLTSKLSDAHGNPILDGSDYAYECRVIDTYSRGDHTLFIADITAVYRNDCFDGHTTLFLGRGQYATPSAISSVKHP